MQLCSIGTKFVSITCKVYGTVTDALKVGFSIGLHAVSSATMDGMINLGAALGRIFKMGEELED